MRPPLAGKNMVNKDGNVVQKVSDHPIDMRLERRWKRRCIAFEGFKKGHSDNKKKALSDVEVNVLVDEDCTESLNGLGENDNAHFAQDDDIDPHYKMFLDQLRENGNSYVLEVSIDDEISQILKYEEDDAPCNELKQKNLKKLRTNPSEDNKTTPKKLRNVASKVRRDSEVEKNIQLEHTDLVSSKKNENLDEKDCAKVFHSYKPVFERDFVESGLVDESYQVFLNYLRWEGGSLVFVHEDDKPLIYEEDDGKSSFDSEVLAADTAPYCSERKYTPFAEVDEVCCIKTHERDVSSLFRDNLMVVLRKPYDPREYDELLQHASLRKPLERFRDLRGRIKPYSAESCSKSYLDHHRDLAKEIDSCQPDCHKVLNLLRGFFYWLQHGQLVWDFPDLSGCIASPSVGIAQANCS
ncbi:uncharacterized protein LOC131162363 isoform X3 [Malania oleifera]|uniref:uncharacterized protein LOC131162363 isoform X3 n=1 Tax=Malania oleifera TaxID=397392 RepID=UPI0025ADBD8A|nr:uncharacterized protein LOC131162363 isoform X3 [Malania oleifera]